LVVRVPVPARASVSAQVSAAVAPVLAQVWESALARAAVVPVPVSPQALVSAAEPAQEWALPPASGRRQPVQAVRRELPPPGSELVAPAMAPGQPALESQVEVAAPARQALPAGRLEAAPPVRSVRRKSAARRQERVPLARVP
jgi:hypothetical protein